METSANAATQSAVRRKTRFNLIGVLFNNRFVGRLAGSLQRWQRQRPVRTAPASIWRWRLSRWDMCESRRPITLLNEALIVDDRRRARSRSTTLAIRWGRTYLMP